MAINAPTQYKPRRLVPARGKARLSALASLPREGWLWGILIVSLDVLTWGVCFGLDYILRGEGTAADFYFRLPPLGIMPLIAILLTLFVVGGFDRRTDMLSLTYMSEHLIGMATAMAAASLVVYCGLSFGAPVKPGRGALLLSFVTFTPLSLVYRRKIYARTRAETEKKYFLVLGDGEAAQKFLTTYRRSPSRQSLRFVGFGEASPGERHADGRIALDEEGAFTQLDALGPDNEAIVVTVPFDQLSKTLQDRLVRIHFQQAPVYTLDAFYEVYWRRVPVDALNPAWPLQMGFQLSRTSPYRHFKRLCDLLSAGLGFIVLSPLLVVIAAATWWDSGMPIIFRQERVGLGGEPFTIFKFRSMTNRQAGSEGELYTRTNDARITRVGKWLRKLRLDELPQLWNVLRGDMSLIGPRAEWVKCAQLYEGNIPSYHFRHLVKPGITGWAQVNYSYGESEEDAIQKLKYDLYYIRRYSLRLDAMIVLKTLHIMFWGKGQ